MRQMPVPVTLGSPWFRIVDTGACRVTEAQFSAGDILHAHSHDRPIMAVMLRGRSRVRNGTPTTSAGAVRASSSFNPIRRTLRWPTPSCR
jgi:quercetin dioxygenase-like cupin family protein